MTPDEIDALADRFFAAICAGDVDAGPVVLRPVGGGLAQLRAR